MEGLDSNARIKLVFYVADVAILFLGYLRYSE